MMQNDEDSNKLSNEKNKLIPNLLQSGFSIITQKEKTINTKKEKKNETEMQRSYYPIHQKYEAIPSLFYAYNQTAWGHRGDRIQLLRESNL